MMIATSDVLSLTLPAARFRSRLRRPKPPSLRGLWLKVMLGICLMWVARAAVALASGDMLGSGIFGAVWAFNYAGFRALAPGWTDPPSRGDWLRLACFFGGTTILVVLNPTGSILLPVDAH
jgi:hypothetical protein